MAIKDLLRELVADAKVPLSSRPQLSTSSSWLRFLNLTTMGFRHQLSGFFPLRELTRWKEILLTVLITEINSPSLGIFLSEIYKGRFSHAAGLEIQDGFLHGIVFFSQLDHSLGQGFHWLSESYIESDLLLAKLQRLMQCLKLFVEEFHKIDSGVKDTEPLIDREQNVAWDTPR